MKLMKIILGFLVVFALIMGLTWLSIEHQEIETPILLGGMGICFAIIVVAVLQSLIKRAGIRRDYHIKKNTENRVHVSSEKKLPIYHWQWGKILLFSVLTGVLIYIVIRLKMSFSFSLKDYWIPIVAYFIIMFICFFQKDYILKNSLLFCYSTLADYFNVQEVKKVDEHAWKKRLFTYYETPGRRGECEEITILHNNHVYRVGSAKKVHYNKSYSSNDSGPTKTVLCLAYVDCETNLKILPSIELKFNHTHDLGWRYYQKSIYNHNYIVPHFTNLPTIYCMDTEYAQRIMNENVQGILSELGKSLKNYVVRLEDGIISIELRKVLWSTAFMRIFRKNKATEDIIYSIEKIVDAFEKIVSDIERNSVIMEESPQKEKYEKLKEYQEIIDQLE